MRSTFFFIIVYNYGYGAVGAEGGRNETSVQCYAKREITSPMYEYQVLLLYIEPSEKRVTLLHTLSQTLCSAEQRLYLLLSVDVLARGGNSDSICNNSNN